MADQGGTAVSGRLSSICTPSTMASSTISTGAKPVPMKLFSTWEVDKSTPSCIPRLCSLTLTRLVVLKPLESDLQSLIIAIKMQSSKRILRSHEIILQPNGLLDTELDLSFVLQYPHFLKRDGNRLQMMLQRRKKYKNRTILGYKTLAAGQINMSQVLQHPSDQEMYLYAEAKDQHSSVVVAQVMILSLCSQPVDHDDRRQAASVDVDRSPAELSDEDDIREDPDFSSNDDMSDVDPLPGDDDRPVHHPRKIHTLGSTFTSRQRNLKQKFVALLRRFKVNDEVLESAVQDLGDHESNPHYVEDLFDDVENLSESDPDIDTISVHSTPKPRLRPFFAGKGSSNSNLEGIKSQSTDNERLSDDNSSRKTDSDSNPEFCSMDKDTLPTSSGILPLPASGTGTGGSASLALGEALTAPAKRKRFARKKSSSLRERKLAKDGRMDRRNSTCYAQMSIPRRVLLDQMAAILSSDNALPECLILINTNEWQGQLLAQSMQNAKHRTVCTCSAIDVRAVISAIVNKIQKYCNKNNSSSLPMKIAVVGGDAYINSVLRPYVDLFSSKSSDWLNYIRFLIVPFGNSTVARNLAALDVRYAALFNDSIWKESIYEKSDNNTSIRFSQSIDLGEIASRIMRYVSSASHLVQLPLAEAIITNKDKGIDDCSQLIVPFIGEVRLGPIDTASGASNLVASTAPSDCEDFSVAPIVLSSSPPSSSHMINDKSRDLAVHSPTLAQNATTAVSHVVSVPSPETTPSPVEAVDLQVDYWMIPPKMDAMEKLDRSAKKEVKCSLKTMFRSMQVFRPQSASTALPQQPLQQQPLPQHTSSSLSSSPPDSASLPGLSMIVVTREKKQKIMRIGKKSKELDAAKSQQIDGISRLICTSKSQSHPLSVTIDGVDWPGVKFFQVSAQWQTHVKHFPVLIFGASEIPI